MNPRFETIESDLQGQRVEMHSTHNNKQQQRGSDRHKLRVGVGNAEWKHGSPAENQCILRFAEHCKTRLFPLLLPPRASD